MPAAEMKALSLPAVAAAAMFLKPRGPAKWNRPSWPREIGKPGREIEPRLVERIRAAGGA